jgi:hypothetical protein
MLLSQAARRLPMRSTFLVLCAALTAAACSSSSSPSDTGTDGGEADSATSDGSAAQDSATADSAPADSSPDDASDGGTACNTLANIAQTITIQQVASDPPTAQGGTFADGTYAMTDVTIYTGTQGPTGPSGTSKTTIQISGDTFQVVNDGTPGTRTVSAVVSGTSVTATDTCPDSTVFDETFTATTTSFVVYLDGGTDDAGARTVAETFTKQ